MAVSMSNPIMVKKSNKPKLILLQRSDRDNKEIDAKRLYKIIVPHRPSDRELLIKWLKQRPQYSVNLYKDPGYSVFYKNEFNYQDVLGPNRLYVPGDIDHELNVGYVNYHHGDEKHEDDKTIEQFIDYVPVPIHQGTVDTESTKRIDNIKEISIQNIVILPGSNHSNANFLFKRLKFFIAQKNTEYKIPFVSADPSVSYKGEQKIGHAQINKEQFYGFLCKNSRN